MIKAAISTMAAVAGLAVSAAEPRFPFQVSYGGAEGASSVAHFLDAPAGKHGFVRVEGADFVTDSGPIRFNATNLTGPANFPSHEDAEKLADRLARLGLNCVRLHYMDTWYGNFLHGDGRTQCLLADDSKTQRKFDPAQLDKLDYLVAALKKRGIYVNMNLHVARGLDERDGCPKGSPWANKTVGQFMPRMVELQKEYARDLITHRNPYTGKTYAEEPAVAMFEISNEDPGIVQFDKGGKLAKLRPPFKDELRRQWNAHLAKNGKTATDGAETPLFCDDKEGLAELKHEWARFLWNTEKAYWNGMRDFIHGELKAPQPVSGTQVGYSPLTIQKELDYVDAHAYFHHPEGRGGAWKKPGITNEWTVGGESMVHSLKLLSFADKNKYAPEKPFTVSEYSNPYPSPFIAECQPIGCAWARMKGWDGVFQYSYNHYPENFAPESMPWCIFDGIAHSALLVHFPACSAIMVRGDMDEDREGKKGEFVWNRDRPGKEYVAVVAENTKIFAGYADGREIDLGGGASLSVGETETGWAVVSLVSRLANGFGGNGKASILLAASGAADNEGTVLERKSATRIAFAKRGGGKVMVEGIPCKVFLPVAPEAVKCRALDGAGNGISEIVPAASDDGRALLELSPAFRTLWYEIEIAGGARTVSAAPRREVAGADGAKPWRVRFREPASWGMSGWKTRSLQIGNGHMGVSEFGGMDVERLQITEPTFQTAFTRKDGRTYGNMADALDVSFDFGHKGAKGYVRELDVENALLSVEYDCGGVEYSREMFVSYPGNVGAAKFKASRKGALSFLVKAAIPFKNAAPPSGRTGSVEAAGDVIRVRETSDAYGVKLAGAIKIVSDGKVEAKGDGLAVSDATEATVFYSLGTNHRFVPEMFSEARAGAFGPDPMPEAERRVADAAALGWDALKSRHVADFRALAGRSEISIPYDPADVALATPELLRRKPESVYLALLCWKFGKYMLASSSRPGTMPCSLQGCWSGPQQNAPFGSGWWHNINVQMNYWGAFSANMAECFEAYAAYSAALRPAMRNQAVEYLEKVNPASLDDPPGDDMWGIGTAAWAYDAKGAPGVDPGGMGAHTGPGASGLATAMFVDWYDYTQRRDVLEKHCWPSLHGAAEFIDRAMVETNGLWLTKLSASPEQLAKKPAMDGCRFYRTTGCAFDQQMAYLNDSALVRFAKILDREDDSVAKRCAERMGKYDPVQTGADGQIKEYREEDRYAGLVKERHHRHISQLHGLFPGAIICRATPGWLKAASRTLDLRGDMTEGFAIVFRMCCRARTGEGAKIAPLFLNLVRERTSDNLWTCHGILQLDGSCGIVAAFDEALLQSHETDADGDFIIDLLPALPPEWAKEGSFKGLRARGGAEVDCEWRDGKVVKYDIREQCGRKHTVRIAGGAE